MADRVSKRRTRLRFKKTAAKESVGQNPSDESHASDNNSNGSPPKQQPRMHSPPADELTEWGPRVNGYRFIGTKDSPKHYRPRDWLVTDMPGASSSKDFYNWSYMELPEYHADDVEDKYMGDHSINDQSLSYDQYHKEWELIRKEGHRSVIFPLKHTTDDLTLDNVDEFINTATDYLKALKVERIRWHPDKMLHTLKITHDSKNVSDQLLQKKITTTFQLINQLWQSATTK